MGNDATTRREFMRFLYRGTIGSMVDEFFNDASANEPKAKPDRPSPRATLRGRPLQARRARAASDGPPASGDVGCESLEGGRISQAAPEA
jgi:hypothetical protein